MPTEIIAVGQFNLSFLNTAVCGLVLIFFGVGLGTGIFGGSHNLLLTLLPAVIAAIGILAVLPVGIHKPASAACGAASRDRPRASSNAETGCVRRPPAAPVGPKQSRRPSPISGLSVVACK
jgi:hypothetical protein